MVSAVTAKYSESMMGSYHRRLQSLHAVDDLAGALIQRLGLLGLLFVVCVEEHGLYDMQHDPAQMNSLCGNTGSS